MRIRDVEAGGSNPLTPTKKVVVRTDLTAGGKCMFDFFKRSTPAKAAQPRQPAIKRRAAGERPGYDPLEPLPRPEVTEGNEDSDWSLWENSIAFQDSQIPEQYPKTKPAPLEAADADDSGIPTGYDTVRRTDL